MKITALKTIRILKKRSVLVPMRPRNTIGAVVKCPDVNAKRCGPTEEV